MLFSLALLAVPALASLSYDKDAGKIASISSTQKDILDQEIALKEICYRNLYADIDEFKVKNSKELLISDTKGESVFLSDGLKKSFDDVEYYYEEFCYKQYNSREHSLDLDKSSGILVGKRDFASNIGLDTTGGLGSLGVGSFGSSPFDDGEKKGGSGGGDDQKKAGDNGRGFDFTSSVFSPGSFMSTFANSDGFDVGLDKGLGGDGYGEKASGPEQPHDDSKQDKDGAVDDKGGDRKAGDSGKKDKRNLWATQC
ncbi:uncharacterized protein JCM10292_003355 [Rhodotorula paludigena]|uniref:uncharacterized protein n=1 Tax=Rhodotorula paludigena TaxID=86838 RepID=UPI00317A20CA